MPMLIQQLDVYKFASYKNAENGPDCMTELQQSNKFPFPATFFILSITGILFIPGFSVLTNYGIDSGAIINLLRNHRYFTLQGEYWRLLSSMLIHDSQFVLLVNFHALLFFGLYLEPLIGKWKLLFAYLVSGVLAAAASITVIENQYIAGAEGAIAGLAGIYLAIAISGIIDKRNWLAVTWGSIIYIIISIIIDGHSWISLAGGFLGGFISGLAYYPVFAMLENKAGHRKAVLVMIALILCPVITLMLLLPNKVKLYEEKMVFFMQKEHKADSTFYNLNQLGKEQRLQAIKQDCIEGWKQNELITNELSGLDLPEPVRYKNKLAKRYCKYQLQRARLKLRSLQDDKYYYTDGIMKCEREMDLLRNQMGRY
jgi:rhomboid protease GluP